MGSANSIIETLDTRIADRLRQLRAERGWSLDQLAQASGVSRASLSRLENAETSPTAAVLGKLCAAFGLTLSRLMAMVEEGFEPLLTPDAQPVWCDPETGLLRRSVSPPAGALTAELLECTLPAGRRIAYEAPPVAGLEHHLYLLEGRLDLSVGGTVHRLSAGDCLRYRLFGASNFETPPDAAARYLLAIV